MLLSFKASVVLLIVVALSMAGLPLYAQVAGQVTLKDGKVFQGDIIEMSRGVLQARSLGVEGKPTVLAWKEVTGLATMGPITVVQDNGVILTGIASFGKQGVIQLYVESVDVTIPIGVDWVMAIRPAESVGVPRLFPVSSQVVSRASATPGGGRQADKQLTDEEIQDLRTLLERVKDPKERDANLLTKEEIKDLREYLATLDEPEHRKIKKLPPAEVADLKKKLAVNTVLLHTAENHLGQSHAQLPDKGWIPVTGIPGEVRLSGFIQAALVHDFRDSGIGQQEFIPAEIPVKTVKESQTAIDPRSSRFFLEGRTHLPKGHFASTFFSLDMRGGGADTGDTVTPRLRQAYVTVDNFTFGQATTTFALASSWPAYLDAGQPPAFPLLRVGLFRYSFPLDAGDPKKSIFTVALENEDTDVLNAKNRNKWPQIVLRYDLTRDWGTLMWSGIARDLVAEGTNGGGKDEAWVFGGSMNGIINIPREGKMKDALKFGILWGNGLGNVISDLNIDGNNDGVYKASTGKIKTTTQGGGWVAYEHGWTQTWRSTFLGSFVHQDNLASQGPDKYKKSYYGMVNLMWIPIPRLSLSWENFYGRRVNANGNHGESWRTVFAARYFLGGA